MSSVATYRMAQPPALWLRMRDRLHAHIDAAPRTFDALTPDQFIAIANAQRSTDDVIKRALIVKALLELSWRTPLLRMAFWLCLSADERRKILKLADPFMGIAPMRKHQLLCFRTGWRTLRAVHADVVDGLDVEEFGKVDRFFRAYPAKGNIDLIRAMAAILYRVGHPDRAARFALHAPTMRSVNALKDVQLFGIWFEYACHRAVWEKESPLAFGEASKKPVRTTWMDVITANSGRLFGDRQTTATTSARVFLRYMHKLISNEAK